METGHPSNFDMRDSSQNEPQNLDDTKANQSTNELPKKNMSSLKHASSEDTVLFNEHEVADSPIISNDELFDVVESTSSKKVVGDISEEKAKIEAELKLATRLVDKFAAPADLKKELIDFIVDYYDITQENAPEILEQASTNLKDGMRDFLAEQGLHFNKDGTIDNTSQHNAKILNNVQVAAGLEKYVELVDFESKIHNFKPQKFEIDTTDDTQEKPKFSNNIFDSMFGPDTRTVNPDDEKPNLANIKDFSFTRKLTEAEQEERDGKLVYQALEKYKFSTDVEDFFVHEILNIASKKSYAITPDTVDGQLLSVADRIKIEIAVGLLKRDFSIDSSGHLTLPEEKKSILHDETISWNLELLTAANTILKPNEHNEVVTLVPTTPKPTEDTLKENSLNKNETINSVTLEQELQNLGFSNEAITAAQNPELISLMAGSTIEATGNKQRGLKGFEQVINRVILDLQQKSKFTLDSNNEPVPEGLLQKSLFFFNKTKQINKIKSSPEYAQLRSLLQLKTETEQKMRAEIVKNSSKRTITETTPVPKEQKVDSFIRRNTLPGAALVGAAAGIMAGTALYKNQETDALESFDENTLVVSKKEVASKKQTSPTFSPRFEEIDSTQPRRPLSEAPTVVDVPVVTAREAEPASTRTANQVLEETKPTVVKKSTFKKPTSFGSKQAPKRFKIDPFTYQDTDPTTAPKLERPADDSDYEEAPDLDNPPAYHKRLVEKTFKKPTPITKETVRNTTPGKPVPRQKESPYLATPSVSGTVKGPEEKVKPQLSLSADKQKTNGARYENKTLPDLSISKDSSQQDTYTQKNTEKEIFNKMYFVGQDIYYKIRELANIEIDRPKIEAGETRINPALLAKHEQKIRADLKQMWINFAVNKNQALKIGEEMIKNLKDRLTNTTNKKEIEVLTNQIATLRGEIRDIEDIAQHSTDSLFQKIKEERSADLANALKKMNRSKNKPEANPVLKPVARQKESPYLATPSVPGTVKGPEEKVNPEFSLDNKLEPYPVLKRIKKKPDNTLPAGPNVAKAK